MGRGEGPNIEIGEAKIGEADNLGQRSGWNLRESRTRNRGKEDRGLLELEATGFLIQKVKLGGETLVDDSNGFNKIIRPVMPWTVRHHWLVGARFAFNFYKHLAQLLFYQLGSTAVTILSQEGVTQGDPLLVVLYGITLITLAEELWAADPGLLTPFYEDDVEFFGSERRSAHILKLLMGRGKDQWYLTHPAKLLLIENSPD